MSAVAPSPSTAWAASLFEHSPIGQALVTPEGGWVRVNPALARLLGREPGDFPGTPVAALVHPDDRAALDDDARTLLAGGPGPSTIDVRWLRADGTAVRTRQTSALVTDALTRPRYLVVQVEDLEPLRDLEQEVRRLYAVFDRASDLVVVMDETMTLTYVSPAAERLLGKGVAEVVGTQALDHVHPDDRELGATELLDTMVSSGEGAPTRLRLLAADGELVPVEALAANLLDDEDVRGIVISLRDARDADGAGSEPSALDLRYRALADAARDAIVTIDADDQVWSWNAGARHMLGYAAEDAIGGRFTDFVPAGLPADGEVREVDARHQDGHDVPVEMSVSTYEHLGVTYRLAILRDVSARRAAEAAAAAADLRFRTAFEAAPIGIALVGLDGRFMEVNQSLCSILGRSAEEIVALTFQDITHPEDLDADLALLDRLLAGDIPGYRMEKRYQRADGDLVWAQLSVTMVRDEQGEPAHFISQIEDITERKALDDGLAYQAHHDALTGLLNRHAVLRRLDQALGRRHLTDVTALFVDLDGFKRVNDTYGHAVGDDVLRAVAQRITATLRPGDVAARIGGDEFVALLEGVSGPAVDAIAVRVARAIAAPVLAAGDDVVQVDASIGYATATLGDVEASALLARADAAMYEVKAAHRQRGAAARN